MNRLQNKLAKILRTGTVIVNKNYIEWSGDNFFLNTQRQPRDTAKTIAERLLSRANHVLG